MGRSQQVKEITKDSEKLEEECDLIREDFGSCSIFEIMSIQPHFSEVERISRYVKREYMIKTKK